MLYHAFEVVTDGAYDLQVDQDESKLKVVLDSMLAELKEDDEEVLEILVGTTDAPDVGEALNNIRSGEWQFTNKRID